MVEYIRDTQHTNAAERESHCQDGNEQETPGRSAVRFVGVGAIMRGERTQPDSIKLREHRARRAPLLSLFGGLASSRAGLVRNALG